MKSNARKPKVKRKQKNGKFLDAVLDYGIEA
jgi:hypothetical protein